MRILLLLVGVTLGLGCERAAPTARVVTYGFELEDCNDKATTCAESIACENEVRRRYNRPLRDATKGCK